MTAHHTMLQFISSRDHRLMRKVNQWRAPKWIRLWAIFATRAGDGWLWYLTGLLVMLFGGENRFTAVAVGRLRGVRRLMYVRHDQETIGTNASMRH